MDYPDHILKMLRSVTAKRAKVVIDHILAQDYITTEELETLYGYKHPPRAARDVREQGIPLETFTVKSSTGKSIAAYRFGDFSQIQQDKLGGRKIFSKEFKEQVIAFWEGKCAICQTAYEDRYLQLDHCVPYQVAGDVTSREVHAYMPLCASCNRAKSWSCEHCQNGLETKEATVCQACYWANPQKYEHIALQPIRRIDLVWQASEVEVYEQLVWQAKQQHLSLSDYLKSILAQFKDNFQV